MESEPNAQEADRIDDTVQQRAIPLLGVISDSLNPVLVASNAVE